VVVGAGVAGHVGSIDKRKLNVVNRGWRTSRDGQLPIERRHANVRHTHEVLDRFIPFGENPRRHFFARLIARRRLSGMVDQTYLVTLRPPSRAIQHVVASTGGVHGDHLVFLDPQGQLAAMFLLELVESRVVLE
jgi:hypothetical protein